MPANTRIVLILVFLVAGAGLVGYFAMQDPAPMSTGPTAQDESVEPEVPPVPTGRPGVLTGVVRVFGTEAIAPDIEVRIEGAGDAITCRTNGRGVFVANVPSGPEVTVTAFAPDPYADVVISGVRVKPDATTSLGTLYLAQPLLVKGVVLTRAGEPVAGATVEAYRPVIGDSPAANVLEAFTSMTKPRSPMDSVPADDEGRFTLTKLSPGTYRLEAKADGFAIGAIRDVTVSPESSLVEHRIVLGPGHRLDGTVETPNGLPVPEALISVIRTDTGRSGIIDFSPVQTRTNDEGRFSFANLSPGRANIAVRAEGYPTKMMNEVNIGLSVPLKVVLGGTASIRGRITNSKGNPVEGAAITIAIGQRDGALGEALTDTDGRYLVENLPEGRIQFLRVEAAGLAPWPVIDSFMMFQRGFGDLTSGQALVKDIELAAGSRVHGRVTSKGDGQPIEGATVYLMGGFSTFLGSAGETVTDEDGNYEVVGVARGLYQVVVKAAGFYQGGLDPRFMQRAMGFGAGGSPTEGSPEVKTTEGGPDQQLDIAMLTGATARGTVLSPDNEPVAGARVTVGAKADTGWRIMGTGRATPTGPTAITDENGNFRLVGLEAGDNVRFEAETDDWVKGYSEPVSLAAGEETPEIVVTLKRGGFITGTITGHEGGPLAGAEIRTLPQTENAGQWEWQLRSREPVLTDEQGRFRVENLTPGPWILRAEAPGHRILTKFDIAVPQGADGGPLDLELDKGFQISGVVVDADGKPISDVNLWTRVAVPVDGRPARGGSMSIRNATTDSEGKFLLDQLEAASYTITVNASGYADKSLESIDAGTSDLRVVLDKGLSISGRVLLPDGSPAANRWVTARSEKDDTHSDRTGEDGTFEIENLPEGVYDVWANTGGAFRFMSVKDEGPSLMPTQQAGVPAGTKNLEIRLRHGAVVGGRVTDENGNPIRGASLWFRSLGEGENASGFSQTDENGEFRVTGLAPGRRVSINVSHGDYGPLATQEVDSDSTGLSFVLPPKPTQPDPEEQPTEPR